MGAGCIFDWPIAEQQIIIKKSLIGWYFAENVSSESQRQGGGVPVY